MKQVKPKQPKNQIKMIPFLALTAMLIFCLTFTHYANATPLTTECQEFISEIPSYFTKGFIEVPEDWSQPSGRKIKVFYYGQIPPKNSKQKPLVFFNGGPTFSSHSSFGRFQTQGRWPEVAILYIDQRGTGCSDPFPTELSQETVQRLSHYGSRAIVQDAEAIREKLLGKKSQWQVFGQSYGGLIAHRYLSIAPSSLYKVHIHGHSVMNSMKEFYKLRLLSQKRISKIYFERYPKDLERLQLIRNQILPETCFQNESVQICGTEIIDGLSFVLGMPTLWEDGLHSWITGLLNEKNELIQNRLKRFANSFVLPAFAPSALSAAVIAKLEMTDEESSDQCTDAIEQIIKDGDDPSKWPLNECRLASKVKMINTDTDAIGKLLEEMKTKDPLKLTDLQSSLSMNKSLKLYLYSGEIDAYVPKETFVEEISLLKDRVQYQNFDFTGHDGYYLESVIIDNIL